MQEKWRMATLARLLLQVDAEIICHHRQSIFAFEDARSPLPSAFAATSVATNERGIFLVLLTYRTSYFLLHGVDNVGLRRH